MPLLCVSGNSPVRNRVHHQTVHRVHALTFIFITLFPINIFKIFFLRIKVNEMTHENQNKNYLYIHLLLQKTFEEGPDFWLLRVSYPLKKGYNRKCSKIRGAIHKN